MKKKFVLVFCILISLQSFSQEVSQKVFFNGIDTFFVRDNIAKYIKENIENRFTLEQTDTIKGHLIRSYSYNKDLLIPYKIDTISFRYMGFTFQDSILSNIFIVKFYFVKDFENVKDSVINEMRYLKNYISQQLNKKGKAKKISNDASFIHYGYKWVEGDYSIILSMQYSKANTKYISLELYFEDKKLYD